MSKNLKVRLAVGGPRGPRSSIWRVFTNGDDVYAAHRSMLAVEKFSFHASRICRRAFVVSHPRPNGMSDRVLHRWMRIETPPAGSGEGSLVLSIVFPTAHLSDLLAVPSRSMTWVPAAAPDSSRVLQLFFTNDGEAEVAAQLVEGHRSLVKYHRLPGGEALAISSGSDLWEGKTLILAPAEGRPDEIVLPCFPTPSIPRKVLFTLFEQPDEGVCFELTGFKMPAGKASTIFTDADHLTSPTVIDRRDAKDQNFAPQSP